ncbi:unnamed protein product [Pleuronectes platessa]|uniref:Uncharacterized protein n=1 Tax=Pleuronectes platessa TaxID=8262 RepID=A0A9N7V1D8_PLEPL|nr:unnamed protein product [Pleuronectes platessa]
MRSTKDMPVNLSNPTCQSSEDRQSTSTEAKLNGKGEIKGSGGACSLCIQSPLSPSHLSLHADGAAVKGAMHPATPIHNCKDPPSCSHIFEELHLSSDSTFRRAAELL